MLLKKISLNNIRSYENIEIEFPRGSTLLSGDIGSGKTSVLLAIEFALFGLQPGQRGAALLRNGKKQGGATIEFEVDGKQVIIERTLKRGKTITQDYCAITIDDEKREIAVTELKNKILELLNYPFEFSKKQNILYKFTVYTPQEEMKQIILEDSQTRVNTLRHVFGIDKYKRILENSSIIASKLREEKRRKEGITENLEQDKLNLISKEEDLDAKQHNLVSVEKELFAKQEKRKRVQEEREEIKKKIEEKNNLENEIQKSNIMLANKREAIESNNKLAGQINQQIAELRELSFDEELIIQLQKQINENRKKKEKLNQQNLEINSEINRMNFQDAENKKLGEKISSLEKCPTCLQEVDPIYRANVLNKIHTELGRNKNQLEELEILRKQTAEKIQIINADIQEKENKLSEFKILKVRLQSIDEKQNQLKEIEQSSMAIQKDIELLASHSKSLIQFVEDLKKFDGIFKQKTQEFEQEQKNERQAEIKVAELKKEIDVFSNQIEELRQRINSIQEIKKQLDYLMKLEDWLTRNFNALMSHIEKNVMTKLKKQFSELFNEWFCMLVAEGFNARLDDEFTPIVEQQDYEIDYTYLSGGERTAIALAYRLALNQVINSFLSKIKTKDLVILDEPTDGFSEQQLDKMRDVLQELNAAQLILVSHEQKIESFVENVIRFRKEGGVSVVDKG